MIDALAQGKLAAAPQQCTTKTGKSYAIARMRIAVADGESIFASLAAFDEQPCKTLLALGAGDSLAVSGSMKLGIWNDKDGNPRPNIDIICQQVLTVYQVKHKRTATQGGEGYRPEQAQPPSQNHRPKDEAWRARAQHDSVDGQIPF